MAEVLNSKTMIPVVNKRSNEFTAVLRNGDIYEWMGATSNYEDTHELTFQDVQHIHARSTTFRDGYLFIDNVDARKRLGLEKEEIKINTISRADIEKALKGSIPVLKKMLENVKATENHALMREVATVTKEIKVDNTSKLQLISEYTGVPLEILIDQE